MGVSVSIAEDEVTLGHSRDLVIKWGGGALITIWDFNEERQATSMSASARCRHRCSGSVSVTFRYTRLFSRVRRSDRKRLPSEPVHGAESRRRHTEGGRRVSCQDVTVS